MKKVFYIIILISFSRQLLGQTNLVPNPSFEIQDTCPTPIYIDSPSGFAQDWFDIRNTPDYFTNCSGINFNYQTPNTSFGYQCPANGDSYLGLFSLSNFNPGAQESAAVKLNDSLVKNTKYYVSFKTVHSGGSGVYYATSKMGVKFFTKRPDRLSPAFGPTDKYVNNFAHVYSNTVISDTLNWTTIKGNFIADSNYKYLAVGCFFSYQNSDTTKIFPPAGFKLAYYFYDDICVSTDSNTCKIPNQITCLSTNITEFNNQSDLNISPNPCKDFISINGINEVVQFKIFNNFGQLIKFGDIKPFDKILTNDLPPSLYYIEFKNKTWTKKLKLIVDL